MTTQRSKVTSAKKTHGRRRRLPAIDVHSHVRIAAVEELLRKDRVSDGPGQRSWVSESSIAFQERQARLIRPKHTNPKVRLRDMDAMGGIGAMDHGR